MEKVYLFLQGPHGPFFKELGRQLKSSGAKVLRVNFNGGDWGDWHGADCLNFTASHKQWKRFVFNLIRRKQVTDLMLYGDCRSLHAIAIEQAKKLGVAVHVFEEGYIRPNWVTFEDDGVNGYSHFAYDNNNYFEDADDKHMEDLENVAKVGPSFRWILYYCMRYYLFKSLWSVRFRNYILHRPYRPHQEFLLWLGNLLHMPLLHHRSKKRRRNLFESGHRFYLVCLQLDSDAQLRVHSDYLSMANFVSEVLRSFADHAPRNSFLIFKKHPLDPGAIPYETLIRLEAYSLGIRHRIRFLHSGSLPELIQKSEGVVLMNSTVGTSSLHHGKPTVVLGKAIYNLPGLTWQGGLDRFWKEGVPPNSKMYRNFRYLMLKKVLVHGGFYTSNGRTSVIRGVMEKLEAETVSEKEYASGDYLTLHNS